MVFIERKAYAKMMLHGAKYPYYNVEGVLLGKEGKVLDAVPLSHGTILTNMVEVAVNMVCDVIVMLSFISCSPCVVLPLQSIPLSLPSHFPRTDLAWL